MKKLFEKYLEFVLISILFLILSGIRIYDSNIKNQLHADEVFSVMLCDNNKYYWAQISEGFYLGDELKNIIFNSGLIESVKYGVDQNQNDFVDDMIHLWQNNGDTPHASLYYMLLRTAFKIDDFLVSDPCKKMSVDNIVRVGTGLNMLLFACSFFLFWLLLNKIPGINTITILASLALAFGNTYSIENTLLIREYQLAETTIILLTLISVSYFFKLSDNVAFQRKKYFYAFATAISLTLSSGYLNAFYILIIGGVLIFFAVRSGRKSDILMLIISAVVGLLISWMLYAGFFNFVLFKSVHTNRAFESPIAVLSYLFVRDLTKGVFTIYGVGGIIFISLVVLFTGKYKSLTTLRSLLWLPLAAVLCIYLVQYTAVLKMPRYSFPLVPIVALILPCLLRSVPKSLALIIGFLSICYYPLMAITNSVNKDYSWINIHRILCSTTTLYRLNSTEITQVIPCLNDTVQYEVRYTRFTTSELLPNQIVTKKKECKEIERVIEDSHLLNNSIGRRDSVIDTSKSSSSVSPLIGKSIVVITP